MSRTRARDKPVRSCVAQRELTDSFQLRPLVQTNSSPPECEWRHCYQNKQWQEELNFFHSDQFTTDTPFTELIKWYLDAGRHLKVARSLLSAIIMPTNALNGKLKNRGYTEFEQLEVGTAKIEKQRIHRVWAVGSWNCMWRKLVLHTKSCSINRRSSMWWNSGRYGIFQQHSATRRPVFNAKKLREKASKAAEKVAPTWNPLIPAFSSAHASSAASLALQEGKLSRSVIA